MNPEPGFPRIVPSALVRAQCVSHVSELVHLTPLRSLFSHTVIALMPGSSMRHYGMGKCLSWAAVWMSLFKYGDMQLPSPGGLN